MKLLMSKYPREEYVCSYIDKDGREIFFSPACGICHWYKQIEEEHCCSAFPDGIPPDIWRGKRAHDEPIPGDNGFYYVHAYDFREIRRRVESRHRF